MICARRMVGLIGAAVLLSPVAALAHDEVHFAHDGGDAWRSTCTCNCRC